jgi:hypothetical protein
MKTNIEMAKRNSAAGGGASEISKYQSKAWQ